ncbi:Beta-galactoside alpha-2,6-sialyltransferase 2 [Armadillidium vulgare]|nr:Beta-galactoside alpha-2,6-sialyltransferase 2 [Armadillidium vulgare]
MLMGMMGYMYLLWMQYWKYARTTTAARQNLYQPENSVFHFDEEDTIQIRQGRPRIRPRNLDITHESGFLFPMYDAAPETKETKPPPTTTTTPATLSPEEEKRLIEKHKGLLTVQLRSSQMDGGNILFKHENKYGVKYRGLKEKGIPTKTKLLCALQKANVRTLRDGDEPFTTEGMAKYFPHDEVLEGNQFNTCAVVSSAGSLKDSNLGKFIDVHDFIVRFNHAPTKGMEKDVGFKTHFRILNSQILTKPKFDFWGSPLYRNVSMLVWDPSNYSASLAEVCMITSKNLPFSLQRKIYIYISLFFPKFQWYSAPDFPVFPEYFRRRLMIPHESLHFLHPASLWRIWDVLQMFTHTRVLF